MPNRACADADSWDGQKFRLAEVRRARCIVEGVAKLRGRLGYRDPATDEIPDPAATKKAFFNCADIIDVAVREVIDVLCDTRPPHGVCRQYG